MSEKKHIFNVNLLIVDCLSLISDGGRKKSRVINSLSSALLPHVSNTLAFFMPLKYSQ